MSGSDKKGLGFSEVALAQDWTAMARADQLPPKGDWLIWLLLGGRGAGKTRAGAEWVRAQVAAGARRVALVAPTYNDAREVMLGGESGLLSLGSERSRPVYTASRRRLEWPNGAVGFVFSSEDADGLRGPQFDCAWADEFCAWRYADATLSNLRLGEAPRLVITTTPRPTAALKQLLQTSGLVMSRAGTADNAANLSPVFLAAMEASYGGTALGRQELNGEIIENHAGALFSRAIIDRQRLTPATDTRPDYEKIIVAIDPPVTSGARSDACGLIVAARLSGGAHVHILHDGSVQGLPPEGWAARALDLWAQYDADYLLAEVNQGGEMVRAVLKTVQPDVVVNSVYASRSKSARAEPVAALYSQGRVFHLGRFDALEDELCILGTGNLRGKSPDRADALVWAVTELLLGQRSNPRIRRA